MHGVCLLGMATFSKAGPPSRSSRFHGGQHRRKCQPLIVQSLSRYWARVLQHRRNSFYSVPAFCCNGFDVVQNV